MGKEIYSQFDMFTRELVDTRTRTQKCKAREREKPRQMEMFSQRELAQFGARANPKLPISLKTHIELAIQDARTEEEKARDIQHQLEENTYPMPWANVVVNAQFDNDEAV